MRVLLWALLAVSADAPGHLRETDVLLLTLVPAHKRELDSRLMVAHFKDGSRILLF